MAIVQLRHPTAGQTYYRGKRAEGKSQEALRGLKRRLSAAAYRCLIDDSGSLRVGQRPLLPAVRQRACCGGARPQSGLNSHT
jgi:hypothetical protein